MDEVFQVAAHWYDGLSALRHDGQAIWSGGETLELHGAEGGATSILLSDLRFGEKRRETLHYRRHSQPDFRLIMPADMPPRLARHLPARQEYGGWVDRIGIGKAAIGFGVVSALAVTLFLTAPEWLGPRIPPAWEREIGAAMVGDLGNRVCHTPAGDAALAKLLAAVDPAREKVRAGIANSQLVNAAALPGGQVLLFDGLVQQAESPEELAGVLAHEVGHVHERHVMTALLRQFGLSILLAGADSGVTKGVFGIASMGYSRGAEREADDYARGRMAQSAISPVGSAEFFERMAEKYADDGDSPTAVGWIASHPSSGERANAYRASAEKGAAYRSPLREHEFAALKAMCADDTDVESFDFF